MPYVPKPKPIVGVGFPSDARNAPSEICDAAIARKHLRLIFAILPFLFVRVAKATAPRSGAR